MSFPIKLKPMPAVMTDASNPSTCVEAGESGADVMARINYISSSGPAWATRDPIPNACL